MTEKLELVASIPVSIQADHAFTWEHRMVRGSKDNCGDFDVQLLYLAEVSFDKDGHPYGYNDPFMCAETEDGLKRLLVQLNEALSKPILDYDTDFVKQPLTAEEAEVE